MIREVGLSKSKDLQGQGNVKQQILWQPHSMFRAWLLALRNRHIDAGQTCPSIFAKARYDLVLCNV